jgi:Cys-rich protein (TIGR01571 family)
MHLPTKFQCVELVKGLLIPFVSLSQVLSSTNPEHPKANRMVVGCYTVCYICWACLCLASRAKPGLAALATTLCVAKGVMLGFIRMEFRARFNLRSDYFADWVTATFLWPQVLTQMRQHCTSATLLVASTQGERDRAQGSEDDRDRNTSPDDGVHFASGVTVGADFYEDSECVNDDKGFRDDDEYAG